MTTTGATAAPRRRWRVSEQTRWAYIFLLPWIIGFVVFTAGPMLASLVLSFTELQRDPARRSSSGCATTS